MMRISFSLLSLIGTLILMGCQARHFEAQTWKVGDGPIPSWSKRPDFEPTQKQLVIGDEVILRHRQIANGIPVEGSVFTEIQSRNQPIRLNQVAVESPLTFSSKAELFAFQMRQSQVFNKITKTIEAEGLRLDSAPSLVVEKFGNDFRTIIRVAVSDPKTGEFFEDGYYLNGSFDSRRRQGISFDIHSPTPAQLFPKGPKKGGLAWVNLDVNKKMSPLANTKMKINSQSGATISEGTDSFSFPLSDPRFDLVQVFYFIDQFLTELKDRHGFELPRALSIETEVGYPEKTNAAFYYAYVLRFGTGDGVVFNDLMRDPTVITHEVGHAVIDALSGLPFQGEAGSINEGLADFFAGSALDTPLMGETSFVKGPYRRNLSNKKALTDRVGKMYADSEIISGLLWELREQLGIVKSERLALRILPRLLPSANFESFKEELLGLIQEAPAADKLKIEQVLKERKWL